MTSSREKLIKILGLGHSPGGDDVRLGACSQQLSTKRVPTHRESSLVGSKTLNTNLNISKLANSETITVNFKDQINVSKVLPYRPLSSICFEDKGFVIQHYRDSGGETPRHHIQEHIISISLSGSEQVYRRIDGKYNQTKFAPGCTTILPAGCQHWCSWTSSEFLLLAICPETLSQTILGADSNKTVELKPNFLTSDFLLQQIGINLIETVESLNVDLLYADSLFNLLSTNQFSGSIL